MCYTGIAGKGSPGKGHTMAESRIRYLVKGWEIDSDGIYQQFCDICDRYSTALEYLQLMDVRNEDVHLKIDSIEAIWNVDEA